VRKGKARLHRIKARSANDNESPGGAFFHVPAAVVPAGDASLKVINDEALAVWFQDLLDKFDVERMRLIIILGPLIRENDIESRLVTLIHHRAVTWNHSAHMEAERPRNALEVLARPGDQLIGRARFAWVCPKNHHV